MANNKKNLSKKGASGFRPFVISLALVLVCVLFILLFMQNFLEANNPSSQILSNETYGISAATSNLQSQVNNFSLTVASAQDKLSNSNPSPIEFVFLIFSNAFWIPKDFLSVAGSFINTLGAVIFPLFFGSQGLGNEASLGISILITFMSASLILTIVVLIIKYIRTGESER